MSDYSVWLLEYGYVDRFPASNLFAAQPFEGFRRMPYCFGLIRSQERCILVDTGFWDTNRHRLLTAKYGETLWQPPSDVVRRAGVEPSDVDTIVLTHNDFDHAGCVTAFPKAHVVVQREELERYAAAAALPARFAFLTNVAQSDLPEPSQRALRTGSRRSSTVSRSSLTASGSSRPSAPTRQARNTSSSTTMPTAAGSSRATSSTSTRTWRACVATACWRRSR